MAQIDAGVLGAFYNDVRTAVNSATSVFDGQCPCIDVAHGAFGDGVNCGAAIWASDEDLLDASRRQVMISQITQQFVEEEQTRIHDYHSVVPVQRLRGPLFFGHDANLFGHQIMVMRQVCVVPATGIFHW